MAKLLVALLLCGGANAMGIYGGETNGCGEPCAGVRTIDSCPGTGSEGFLAESDVCYVVDGKLVPCGIIVPDEVKCAKITVPSGSSLEPGFSAHLPRLSFDPHTPYGTLFRCGARRSSARARRS